MALDFLFANKPQAKFEGIKVISFDASLQESHVFESVVTTNPVESGANIADNISINPIALTMSGFITDTPVKILQGLRDFQSGSGSLSKTAHEDLITLFNNREAFTVVTGLATYENMVLRKLTFPRDSKTGKTIRFNCELIQITLANFVTEDLEDENISDELSAKEQAQAKKDVGKKTTAAATAAETQSASLALRLARFAGFF